MNSYIDDIYSAELNDNIKGFLSIDKIEFLRNNATTGKVMQGMEYRPDKISAYYLGSVKYAWIITLINNFVNGIEDYELNKTILIPDISNLELLNKG